MPEFESIVTGLLEASDGTDIGYGPLLQPHQISDFEDWAYQFYTQQRKPVLSNESIVSSFGFGIYGRNPKLDVPDKRFRDTSGMTAWGSPNQILTPILDTNGGPNVLRLFNLHQEPNRGRALDDMIACSEKRRMEAVSGNNNISNYACGVITSILPIPKRDNLPGAVMFQPIYPSNNDTVVCIYCVSTPLLG